jgi:SAM-dependent methyltransferase
MSDGATETVLTLSGTNLRIRHPPGTFAPSPATRLMARVILEGAVDLAGVGFDWGCGTGVLAIAAALRRDVDRVIGIDRSEGDVLAARRNAQLNGVGERVAFHVGDGYRPADQEARREVESLRGRLDFVVANPPASRGDDGFTHRYDVLRGAVARLRPGGVLVMQALSAYGPERVRRLTDAVPDAVYEGVIGSTEPVPLGMGRAGIARQLDDYVAEEARGGLQYHLCDGAGRVVTATESLRRYREDGTAPRGRWQAHRFRRLDPGRGGG